MSVPNEQFRQDWVEKKLKALRRGATILDIGAGECQYKKHCDHLNYIAQDVGEYDGAGDSVGLQTGDWDFSQIDLRCDALDIPETEKYDSVLCTEVLEHVPDAVKVVEKIARLVKPGRDLLLTAPFCSLTHFAPFHYSTGFSSYFYRFHLERLGFEIVEMVPNGGFFDYLDQELARFPSVQEEYLGSRPSFFEKKVLRLVGKILRKAARKDGDRYSRRSAKLLTFGFQIHAKMT